MEDYHVSKFVQIKGKELGLFAIFDGHLGDSVPLYLQKHLFSNILKEVSSSFAMRVRLLRWLIFIQTQMGALFIKAFRCSRGSFGPTLIRPFQRLMKRLIRRSCLTVMAWVKVVLLLSPLFLSMAGSYM